MRFTEDPPIICGSGGPEIGDQNDSHDNLTVGRIANSYVLVTEDELGAGAQVEESVEDKTGPTRDAQQREEDSNIINESDIAQVGLGEAGGQPGGTSERVLSTGVSLNKDNGGSYEVQDGPGGGVRESVGRAIEDIEGPRAGREMVVHAAQREGLPLCESVMGERERYRDPRVMRASAGGEVTVVTTLVPKFDEDKLIFIEGTLPSGRRVYMQLDGGSDVSCVLREHVEALGMAEQMVLRDVSRQFRVRGIGQQAGTGQVVSHDVWFSVLVSGCTVVDWDSTSMAPVGGSPDCMRIEGWFAVLNEMSVPVLVGGDLLHAHDVMPRMASRQVVVQKRDSVRERVAVQLLTLSAVVQRVEDQRDEAYSTEVWQEMARNARASDPTVRSQIRGARVVVPPRSMKAVQLRYTRAVSKGELFAVTVERAELRVPGQEAMRGPLAWVTGWDPTSGVVCVGPPTVMVFNMTADPLEVRGDDVVALICPMAEVTRYYCAGMVSEYESEPRMERTANAGAVEREVSRPEGFPAFLWNLVDPDDRRHVQSRFARYQRPGDLKRNIDLLMYGLKVYADNREVAGHPWESGRGPSEPWGERGPGSDPSQEHCGEQEPLDKRPGADGDSQRVVGDRSRVMPTQRDWRVEEFFRDPVRISKETERSRQQGLVGVSVTATDLEEVHQRTRVHTSGDQTVQPHQPVVMDGSARESQARLEDAAEARARELKCQEVQRETAMRSQRDRDFWVDGVVSGRPTQLAYLVAQAIANMTAYFHPDPDNPPTVKGFIAEIETVDDIPIQARARKMADIQKAYLKAMTKRLIRQGKLEESTGEYSSGLVLVPYHDRIKKFMDKWGDAAQTEMWKTEHEAEVGTFYRCTCDYRALNVKSKSDVFPLPRIDDLLDQIPRGTCHFSAGDVQDAFWTVKLAEWCREKTAIRTHDQHLQWTVLPQGWKGAANYWARVVAKVFDSISQDQALIYQDDVMVHSQEFGAHYRTLSKVYRCLQARSLTFKMVKTHLNMPKATFLGHMVDADGRYPCVEKVKAIMEKDYPKEDVTAVRSFIGMTLYYRNYIYDYANKVAPLHALTRKGVNVSASWTEEHARAVDALKEDLCLHPCLMSVDNSRPFQVRVDACRRGHGIGGVLLQEDSEGDWRPVSWWSRALSPAEKEYSSTELECKALHDIILYYDVYLQGVQFDVFTDHAALIYMVKAQTASNNGRLMRYLMDIQHYNFRLFYKKGTMHLDADAVSRLLKFGETPVYLSADDLEWDKGPVTEEEMLVAKDMEARRLRRIQRAEVRRRERKAMQEDNLGGETSSTTASEGLVGFTPLTREQKDSRREKKANGLRKLRPPPRKPMQEPETTTKEPRYKLRVRQGHRDGPQVRAAPGWDRLEDKQSHPVVELLVKKRKCGYNRLQVVESTLEGAGYGLFIGIPTLKAGGLITSYEGKRLTRAQVDQSESQYIFEAVGKDGQPLYVDAAKEDSCYGRFINDPRDDTKVNAKVLVKGDRMVVIATTDLEEGDEVFIDYGAPYWADKVHLLTADQAEEVRELLDRPGRGSRGKRAMVSQPLEKGEVELQSPGVRKAVVRSRMEQLSEIERERYVLDNVEQSAELAEELQYLVGQTFFDDENGHQYEVESVVYDEDHRAVIAYRRARDGKTHRMDDAPYLVYGDCGILQLCELWGIDSDQDGTRWPQSDEEWSRAQTHDEEGQRLLSECLLTGQEYKVSRDIMVAHGDSRVLYRKGECNGRTRWQVWVPESLRHLCMVIHHEGSAHPGAWRMLQTIKLRFYWPAMRQEVSQHCAECRGCALRSKYHRQPKIPVQEYPEVLQPMGRMHVDLTGELPVTDGNGSKYILVVKDFHTKYVWLFAIKAKDAITVADQLVTELYCRWGIPEMVVTDRGTEFRNKLMKRINYIFRVNRIATTPYNPRSNGFVENHNGTLKDQLYHFVESRQKDWDIFLPTVQLMYNTTVNAATSYTPYYLMFGRECHMPAMGGMMERKDEAVRLEEGMDEGSLRERSVQEQWEEALVSALGVAWENTTARAHENADRGNRAGRASGIQFKEYEVGDRFYRKRNRVRVFKSVQDKEEYKISLKLQARYEGPYKVVEKVSAVLYVAEIDGVRKRVHAINMKPMPQSKGPWSRMLLR